MDTHSPRLHAAAAAVAPLLLAALLNASCSESEVVAGATSAGDAGVARAPPDQPLAGYRGELLDLAFESVSAMPSMPHVKDRSRAQEAVVDTCLELDQPGRALGYIESIENWRRGTAYADLAFYCTEHGAAGEVADLLKRAQAVAETPDDQLPDIESPQGWRRDRIRAKIAKTHLRRGQADAAAPFETDLPELERGEVEVARAMQADAAVFDEQLANLDAAVQGGDFEEIQARVAGCVELFDRFYAEPERRALVADKLATACSKVPRQFGIETRMKLTELALEHEDEAQASRLVAETQALIEGATWELDDRLLLLSRLAGLRHRAGDAVQARADADALLTRFDQERTSLDSLRQARALRPLAEAYQTLGEAGLALRIYRRAAELGAENPNARPRAEELSATCCSMARLGVEPDAALWAVLRQIRAGLVAPW